MIGFTVVFDACVLFPAPLRDLIMNLSLAKLFRAKWTNEIHEEWMQNVLAKRPDLTRRQLERTRNLMNLHAPKCTVTGYEHLTPRIDLPDPGDRHVLAAALHCGAKAIVTFNQNHFPTEIVRKFRIEALHPDAFFLSLLNQNPEAVLSAVRQQRQELKRPPKSVDEFLAILQRQSLPETVARLREFAAML